MKKNSQNPDVFESELTLTFSNDHDGIMFIDGNVYSGSQFKLNRYAPEYGYKKLLLQNVKKKSGSWYEQSFKNSDNFIFRIRSIVKDEKFQKALHGKIIGPIRFYPARSKLTAIIEFQYHLNPDYTRNLEFDLKRNLFGNLPTLEQVKDP